MNWTRFEVIAAHDLEEALADFFVQQGSNGVVVEDKHLDAVSVMAYVPQEREAEVAAALDAFLGTIGQAFPHVGKPKVLTGQTPDENWAVAWKENFKPIRIGSSFLITPPWLSPEGGHRSVITIEPAEAFGTGTHETTQSCLILLEQAVHRLTLRRGQWSMLDIGCGSGILAFGALRLGARGIIAVDIDPKAVAAAVKNARLNQAQDQIIFLCASVDSIKVKVSAVMANLDYRTLKTHSNKLSRLCDRALIVSGVSAELWPEIRFCFERLGLVLRDEILSDEWGSGLFVVK